MKPQIGGQDATFIFVLLSLMSLLLFTSLEPNFDCTHLAMLKLKDWFVSKFSIYYCKK